MAFAWQRQIGARIDPTATSRNEVEIVLCRRCGLGSDQEIRQCACSAASMSVSMAALDYHVLDVFTTERFGGNPLAVVLDADGLDGKRMQRIAREFNLSETVFVLQPSHAA